MLTLKEEWPSAILIDRINDYRSCCHDSSPRSLSGRMALVIMWRTGSHTQIQIIKSSGFRQPLRADRIVMWSAIIPDVNTGEESQGEGGGRGLNGYLTSRWLSSSVTFGWRSPRRRILSQKVTRLESKEILKWENITNTAFILLNWGFFQKRTRRSSEVLAARGKDW